MVWTKHNPFVDWSLISSMLLGTCNAIIPKWWCWNEPTWSSSWALTSQHSWSCCRMLMWRLIGDAELQALLPLIRNVGEWPTGSITAPLPELLKPWVFIQRVAKWRQRHQNVKRLRWLSLFWYIMHFATVFVSRFASSFSFAQTHSSLHTRPIVHTHSGHSYLS